MAHNPRHIIIVNGYGCHLTPELQRYLDRVAEYVTRIRNKSATKVTIIFSGGQTQQRTAPGMTEAGVMKDYLRLKLPCLMLEDKHAFTTWGNIVRAADVIRVYNLQPESLMITIFCETQRGPNVIMLARHFLMPFVKDIDDITVETVSWERADPFKQVFNLLWNRTALALPWLKLAEFEAWRRRRRAKYK